MSPLSGEGEVSEGGSADPLHVINVPGEQSNVQVVPPGATARLALVTSSLAVLLRSPGQSGVSLLLGRTDGCCGRVGQSSVRIIVRVEVQQRLLRGELLLPGYRSNIIRSQLVRSSWRRLEGVQRNITFYLSLVGGL